MRCLNCRQDGIDLTAQLCSHCGIHLPTLMRDLLPSGIGLDGGKYQIEYALGQGGFGITYRAIDLNLDRPVAIKEFFPQAYVQRQSQAGNLSIAKAQAGKYGRWLGRFEREGRILARLNHPGVVKVHSLFKENETAYLVMELLQGRTLRDELDAQPGKKLSPERVATLAAAMVNALDTVHREGVYHLDLKPDNVMITSDGRIVLVDFGAARQDLNQGVGQNHSTRALTPQYAPLELLSGDPVGPESDLFELGMILHESLTGQCPPTVMSRFSQERWEPTDVGEPWRELLTQSLRLERSNRPASVAQWWQAYAMPLQSLPDPITSTPATTVTDTAITSSSDQSEIAPPSPQISPQTNVTLSLLATPNQVPKPDLPHQVTAATYIEVSNKHLESGSAPKTEATQILPELLAPTAGLQPSSPAESAAIKIPTSATQFQTPKPSTPPSPVNPPVHPPSVRGVNRRTLILGGLGTTGLAVSLIWHWLSRTTSDTVPSATTSPPPPSTLASPQFFTFATVTVDQQGKVTQRENKQARYFTENLGNGTILEMVEIPAGTFLMGSPADEAKRRGDESPQHRPQIRRFFMGKFPITQAQWQQVMKSNPSKYKGAGHPVENISWDDAQEFCQKLSQQTGHTYRLPSEAEWEYACRAGKPTPFSFGPTLTAELANYDGSQIYRSEKPSKNRQHSSPVGRFPANPFGLYDMHGNVWEWCEDVWHKSYTGAPIDGSAWISNPDAPVRILRGGSWNSGPENCRAAVRNTLNQQERFDIHGLRVVCDA